MPMSLYQASIPYFIQTLTALSGILDRLEAHAGEKKIDPANFLAMRLHPSMWPLSKQIQASCTTAVGAAARLSGKPVPSTEDSEKTIAELKARIAKSLEFIRSVKPEEIDGQEAREIVVKMGSNEMKFTGDNYLSWFALPNFMFHATTAYNVLRQSGLDLAKRDFLGKNPKW